MPQDSPELQIYVQLFGPDLGRLMHGLRVLVESAAQLAQQMQEIQQAQQQTQPVPPGMQPETAPPTESPWTGAHAAPTPEPNGAVAVEAG